MEDPANTRLRRRNATRGKRALATVVLLGAAAGLLALAGACLPNLSDIVPADAALTETTTGGLTCGDGIITTSHDGGASEACDPGTDAQAPGCSDDCQIECVGGVLDPKSGHCYIPAGATASFAEADIACRALRGHVVTFASDGEVAFVNGGVGASALGGGDASPGYWVGLSFIPTLGAYEANRIEEPGYPYTPRGGAALVGPCPGCFAAGADAGTLPLAAALATTEDPSCVAASPRGWNRVGCNTSGSSAPLPRAVICEREPAGIRAQDCIIGGFCFSVPATADTKSYVVVVSAAEPDQAAQSCAGAFDGGSLLVVGSSEEREQVAHEILARYPEQVEQQLWIGLARQDGGAWTWEDGVLAESDAGRPLPWGNAQPTSAAASTRAFMRLATSAYDTQLAYADDGKNTPRLYICQRPPD